MEIRKDKYLDLLIHSCGNGLIRVITGMRRCGKSYLLFTLFKNYLIKEGVYIINLMDFLRDPEKYMEERV
ncbi:AAA family ATPase [Leyella stercorea]|uniref:AAA family ATPase n=1 Tax=Leyella stercorea TaxID=363265 RepID=UPI003AF4271D